MSNSQHNRPIFLPLDRVEKTSGDYTFEGEVVSVFAKRNGKVRYVVEDDRGLLFIFIEKQLTKVTTNEKNVTGI